LGADYSFSKRTAAYVAYTRVSNDTAATYGIGAGAGQIVGTAVAGSATGMAAGLRHSF
jgi:predicted porin